MAVPDGPPSMPPSPPPNMPPNMPQAGQSAHPTPPAPQPPYYPAPYGAPNSTYPSEGMAGYPSLPQGGGAPTQGGGALDHPFVAPDTLDPRYGRVGRVPWTLRQTVLGTAITVVPWLVFIVATQLLPTATLKPTPRLIDVISGLFLFVFTSVIEAVFLLAPLYHAVWRRAPGTTARDGFRALGFRKTALWPAVGWVVGGIVTAISLEILYGLIVEQLKLPLQTNADRLTQQAHYMPFTIFFTLLVAVVVAPICEEVFFRGYLFGGLLRGMNVWLATLASALIFTVVHGDVGSAVPLLVIGLVLPVLRWRTGSLWPGVALHTLNNLIAALTVLPILLR